METLQLRLDEDSTNGFFEAVFFLEDPVFWEVCHLVCLRLSTRMSFMGRLDTPSFVADLNAWIVVLCSEHEEYRETVYLTSFCDLPPLLFVYFQVNNGVLYVLVYVEDIYIRVLSLLVSILNPYLVSFIFVLKTCDDYGYVVLCYTVH